MAQTYSSFSVKQFVMYLTKYVREHNLGYFKDITIELENESRTPYWENVYMMHTKNRDLKILIFSSVSRKTGWTREKGQDAIRLVYRLQKGSDVRYAKIKKHYRTENLFENLRKTLVTSSSNGVIFSIDSQNLKWTKSVVNAD